MLEKYVYVNTIGCQMNVYDAELMLKHLAPAGYRPTPFLEGADLVILNTCTIRDKAEQKAFSFLGRLAKLKKRNPSLVVGVGGCVAQQEGERILERMPHVDLVFGTQAIGRLRDLVERVTSEGCRITDVDLTPEKEDADSCGSRPEHQAGDVKPARFVTIMRGCDNFCTYCVVPYVRGRELSRDPDLIVREIEGLVAEGVREVTLLGQNVNSYGLKEGLCSFAELLGRVDRIAGLSRVRFTTSHPKDLSGALIQAFADLEKLCNHIHLPVQSGSNRILKRMNRRYTREIYLDKVARLRAACPEIALTSDFIVGFPGETDEDFQETLRLIAQIEFDGVFAFVYSDRPNAPAAAFEGKVPEPVKKERLRQLFKLQQQYTLRNNKALVGSLQEIMVEGPSKQQDRVDLEIPDGNIQWTGRTKTNKIVNFTWNKRLSSFFQPGQIIRVRIEKAFSHSLGGTPVG